MQQHCKNQTLFANRYTVPVFPCPSISQGERIHAFENRCPHTGIGLDWNPGEFMDITGTLVDKEIHLASD